MTDSRLSRSPSEALSRLWALLKQEKHHLIRGLFFQFWQCVSYIPFYAAVGVFIDDILTNHLLTVESKLKWTALFALANFLLWPLHGWFTIKAFAETQRLVRSSVSRLRMMVVEQLQRMSMSYFTRKGAGALSNQLTLDLSRVETFLTVAVNQITTQVLIGFCALIYLLIKNPWLAALALLATPLQILLLRLMSGRVKSASHGVQESGEVFSSRIVEFIAGMRLTKSFGNEMIAAERLSRDIEDLKEKGYEASIVLRWLSLAVQIIWEFTGTLIWCVGGVMYLYGRITLGDLVAFVGLMGFVRQGMMAFFNAYESWSQARPGMDAIIELLNSNELERHPEINDCIELTGEITLNHVHFRYPQSGERTILHDINLQIPAGQKIGLVGETGAGKSSFLEVIMGFHMPCAGSVLYNGYSLSDIGLRKLRSSVAIMSQDSFLWNAPVMENIRYGRPLASDEDVFEAACKAQAHTFITDLPNGYATICGERGSMLSGGQRQRIALARVFLRDPHIIVLDEPTSALDVETEAHLLNDLDLLCQGRTTFIVAHRLSTLRNADRILVFQQGRIIEDGAPVDLLANRQGNFRRLRDLQALEADPR
ncbi:MAG: ABC transporter ATP-binding protein [Luteolibacter sp.]